MKSYKLGWSEMFAFFMLFIIAVQVIVLAIAIKQVAIESPKFLVILLPIAAFWSVGLGGLIRQTLNQIIEFRISDDGLVQLVLFSKKQKTLSPADIELLKATYAQGVDCALTIQHQSGRERMFVDFKTLGELLRGLRPYNPVIEFKASNVLKFFHKDFSQELREWETTSIKN